MAEEVNLSLIKEVQTILGKLIKKPPLTEKLLKKPPFRYLHDLITSIIRETGFLGGLYSEHELNSDNVKDKDAKLNFLDKLISAIKTVTGKNISARPTKIIAGLEVNKTLELLIVIGKAIEQNVDNSTAQVEVAKKEPKKSQKPVTTKEQDVKSTASKSKENDTKASYKSESTVKNAASANKNSEKIETNNTNVAHQNTRSKDTKPKDDKKRENSVKRQDTESSTNLSDQSVTNERSKIAGRDKSMTRKNSKSEKNSASKKTSEQKRPPPSRKPSIIENKNLITSKNTIKEENENVKSSKNSLPNGTDAKTEIQSVSFGNDDKVDISSHNGQEVEPKPNSQNDDTTNTTNQNEKPPIKRKESAPIQRPSSARPGSRRISHSNSFQNDEPENTTSKDIKLEKKPETISSAVVTRPRTATRPPSARPGAPRIRDRGEVSVPDETKIPSNSVNVIEEGKPDQSDEKDDFILIESLPNTSPTEQSPIHDQEQGQLVHQILKTQKELNESVTVDDSCKNSNIEWEAGKQRERDTVAKEIDKIRGFIQTLTSAANPLGKLFDFLQEDVDEMQRELLQWKKVNENLQKQQLAEVEIGKMFLQPLQKQLEEVESSIQEEHQQIANVKNTILQNDEKITKLMMVPKIRTK